tara:strand:+ start:193 stop:336 length:144 start_codon:yes stop_codon:yes gene_type:complete
MAPILGSDNVKRTQKKTRQGSGRGTKFGTIGSKHYVKKNRGQGGRKR